MDKPTFSSEDDLANIPQVVRIVAILVVVVLLLSLVGCATVKPIEEVKRNPPAAAMVKLMPLPAQTDASLGGLFKGYAGAAKAYRGCTDRLGELQEWVDKL